MIRLLIVLILLFLLMQPPALSIVPSKDEVYPGQLFTVTVTTFGVTEPIQFNAADLEVVSTEQRGGTLYVTLRASGEARDVIVTGRAGDLEASAVVRICCRVTAWPGRRVYLPVLMHG
jgi:hypothetical protein